MMATGHALLAAAMLLASVSGQSTLPQLPGGCYYTTSIYTFRPGSFSFSSMTVPSTTITATSTVTLGYSSSSSIASSSGTNGGVEPTFQTPGTAFTSSTASSSSGSSSTPLPGTDPSSSMSSSSSASSRTAAATDSSTFTSFPLQSSVSNSQSSSLSAPASSTTSNPGSISFTTSSLSTTSYPAGPPPDIQPGDEFNIAVDVTTTKVKRAIFYITFSPGGITFLVASKDEAAIFVLDEAGNLISGGLYVGTSSSDGTAALQLFADPPVSPFFWSVENGVLSFGFASFCVTATEQAFVVYDDTPAIGCSKVQFVGDLVPAEASTTISTTSTTVVSPSISSRSPVSSSSIVTPTMGTSSPSGTSSRTSTRSSQSTSQVHPSTPASSTSTTTGSIARTTTASASVASPSFSSGSLSSSTSSPTTRSTTTSSSTIPFGSSTAPSSSITNASTSSSASSASSSSSLSSIVTTFSTTSRTSTFTTSTTSTQTSPVSQIAKRGLAYGNVSTLNFYTPPSQVSWAYNYYSLPNDSQSNNRGPYPPAQSPNMRFYPLLFNDNPNLTSIWEANVNYSITHYGTDAVMSFNEPDLCGDGSACMTVEKAITAYERYIQPFAARGIRLAAPAITNTANGTIWLNQFLGNATARNLTIDIINLHWYASPYNQQYFQDYMTEKYVQFGRRPVWVTEYGMDQFYVEPAILQFIRNTTYWVQQQEWIEKTCWFGNYNSNLLNADGSALSGRGQIWNSYRGNGYVYGFAKRDVGNGDLDGDGAEVDRPEGLATPENTAAFKNLQMEESFGVEWLQKIRGEVIV